MKCGLGRVENIVIEGHESYMLTTEPPGHGKRRNG